MDLPSELNVKGTLNYWFKDCKLTIRSFLLPWRYFFYGVMFTSEAFNQVNHY